MTIPPDRSSLEYKLFDALALGGLLVGPGTLFAANENVQERSAAAGHLRIAFSSGDVSETPSFALNTKTFPLGRVFHAKLV